VELEPNNYRIVLRLADLLARAGRKQDAVKHYEKVAELYIKDDFLPRAIAVYRTILRIDPELISAYENLSELYRKQGLEGEALAQLQSLFEMYEKKGDEDKQIETLKLMAQMDPENLGFQVRLGETLAKQDNKREAAEAFAHAATTLSKRGFHDRASELFEQIISFDPENISIRRELCSHYLESGHYEEAKKEIEAILEFEPDDPRMVLLLGRIQFKLGNEAEAEDMIAKSLMMFSDMGDLSTVIREYLFVARTHLQSGELDEAEAFYRKIEEVAPEETKALEGLASVAGSRGDTAGQIKILLDLARSLSGIDDQTEAARIYRRVLEIDSLIDEARAFLDQMPEEDGEDILPEILAGDELEVETSPADVEDEIQLLDDDATEELMESEDVLIVDDIEEISRMTEGGEEERVEVEIEGVEIEEEEEEIVDEGVEILEVHDVQLEDGIPEIVFEESDLEIETVPEDRAAMDSGESVVDPEIGAEEISVEEMALEEDTDLQVVEHEEDAPEEDAPEEEIPVEAEGVMESSLEDSLIEADVYHRYGLHEKVQEILTELKRRFSGNVQVLEKTLEITMDVSPEKAPAIGRELIESLNEQGEHNKSAEIYGKIAGAMPDSKEARELASLVHDSGAEPEPPAEDAPDIGDFLSLDGVVDQPLTDQESPVEVQSMVQSDDPFAEDIEEAEFFISQGLWEDAEGVLTSILEKSPYYEPAREALDSLQSSSAPEAVEIGVEQDSDTVPVDVADPEESVIEEPVIKEERPSEEFRSKLVVEDSSPESDGFLDLAEELRLELAEEFDAVPGAEPTQEAPVTFEEIFAQFKKGIAETLGSQEYETHYNLGIAYKDMGLIDDAIRELEIASGDDKLLQDSLSLIAMCFFEKQDYDSAVKTVQKALETAKEEHVPGLTYQLGQTYEKQGTWERAMESYERVRDLDPAFEEASEGIERIKELSSSAPDTPSSPDEGGLDDILSDLIKEVEEMAKEDAMEKSPDKDDEPPQKRKKDRVSYL
jgi:tetratricopeptide (TPR) repeat protein